MCGPALLPVVSLVGALGSQIVGGSAGGGGGGGIETHRSTTATIDSQGMEQGMKAPAVSLSDREASENGRARRDRRGRNVFRIDRTAPASSGLGGGGGINVPGV